MNTKGKHYSKIYLPWLLSLLMVLSLISPSFAETNSMSFQNVSAVGNNVISLTQEKDFEATILTDSKVYPKDVTWTLARSKGAMDTKIFPYQYLGGDLNNWKQWGKEDPLFTNIQTKAIEENGKPGLQLNFSTELFFGVNRTDSPRGNRNVVLDYTGDYILQAKSLDGKILGSTTVRVNSYDDYRTNAEFTKELQAAKEKSKTIDGLYMDVLSMGTSTQGYNVPYTVISDSKASIDNYLSQTSSALANPKAMIEKVKSGADYKVPVMFTNIHPDETNGADAPMNFIWDIVNSFDNGGKVTYNIITGFTPAGEAQLKKEIADAGIHWSELIKDHVTGLGFIKNGNEKSGPVDLEKFYTVESYTLDVKELLDNIILIVVPTQNADGRTNNVRQNGNGFDINRDALFQTQIETQNMSKVIAKWNPVTLAELHGYVGGYQVEPCSPPHEPNFEYDLFAENGLKSGEAFGIGAIANNTEFNSYVMPLRDYLISDSQGNPYWAEPWDDMSTNYTPQYSMLHGTVAFTIEVPVSNQEATKSLEYGLLHHTAYVMENKESFYINQLTGWNRGVNNIDVDSISPWYVDVNDNLGAEADVFRPKYAGNNNFFPEAYIIPLDGENQGNPQAAYAMQKQLLDNGVKVHSLNKELTIDGISYKKGSMVVSMYQSKRNVANGALYDGVVINNWPDLYSEPITAFGKMRGFDMTAIDKKGAIPNSALTEIKQAQSAKSIFTGTTDAQVIIDNNSLAAIAMVNKMIDKGLQVGFITEEGAYKSDFVVSYADYVNYSSDYIVKATGVTEAPTAQVIQKSTLYIPGYAGAYSVDANGNKYGVNNYPNYSNTNYNFDLYAYGEQMGFHLTQDPAQASMIVGNRAIDDAALAQVKTGKPYLAAGSATLEKVKTELLGKYGFNFEATGGIQDSLFFAELNQNSLITASNVKNEDNLIYAYGGAYISAVPTGGQVLVQATKDTPLEGFMMAENLAKFLGQVQAIEYKGHNLNVTVFAGSLTNKAHQQDEYQLAANTIFSNHLGAAYQ